MTEPPTILIADDDRQIADAFAEWLDDDYMVRTAYDGAEAIDRLDDDVDVVLLDRRMPEKSGEEVVAAIDEREIDCRIVLISGVDPDFDILELGFDDYLVKPVTEPETVRGVVEKMLRRAEYDSQMQEFLSLASKKATLEAEKSPSELQGNEQYEALENDLLQLRAELSRTATALDDQDLRAGFRK